MNDSFAADWILEVNGCQEGAGTVQCLPFYTLEVLSCFGGVGGAYLLTSQNIFLMKSWVSWEKYIPNLSKTLPLTSPKESGTLHWRAFNLVTCPVNRFWPVTSQKLVHLRCRKWKLKLSVFIHSCGDKLVLEAIANSNLSNLYGWIRVGLDFSTKSTTGRVSSHPKSVTK